MALTQQIASHEAEGSREELFQVLESLYRTAQRVHILAERKTRIFLPNVRVLFAIELDTHAGPLATASILGIVNSPR